VADRARVVLVTGATGFVGAHLCRELQGVGWRVRGLRSSLDGANPQCCEVAQVRDLGDRDGLARAVEGVVAVVHLAAYAHDLRHPTPEIARAIFQINVDGTRLLAQLCVAAAVARVLFVSSVKAVGQGTEEPWTEDTVPSPREPYGQSKLEAERCLAEVCRGTGTAATVLRFPLVYGPGMRANMLRLFDLVHRGVPLPFRGIGNRRSFLYVGNAVAAIVSALDHERARGEVFFVSDGQDVPTDDLVTLIGAGLRRRVRLFAYPRWMLSGAGRIGDALSGLLPVPLTSEVVRRVAGSLTIDSSKFRRYTGYRPPFSLEEGLRRTAEWYLQRDRSGSGP
jgi:nucleoside-diphosphate-sugar epimerase